MTGPASAWDVDGVEVSPIQQRAVMRDLRRALVDPELDGVVLGRALHGGQWKEGFDSAVECVDARIEHLTGHIEGLAAAVPTVERTQHPVTRGGFDVVTDLWALWCDETSVHDAQMTDGERAGFKVAASHMRDPRVRGRLCDSLLTPNAAAVPLLAVGDEVTSAAQLDRLPRYAGVRSNGGQRVRYERLLDGEWYCAGDTRAKKPGQVLAYGAHVADLPDGGERS